MTRFQYQFTKKTALSRKARLLDYMREDGFLLEKQEATNLRNDYIQNGVSVPLAIEEALAPLKRGRPRKRLGVMDYVEILDARELFLRERRAGRTYSEAMNAVVETHRLGAVIVGVKRWEPLLRWEPEDEA